MLLMLLGSMAESGCRIMLYGLQNAYRSAVTMLLNRKALGMFYQKYEAKETRDLFYRAVEAT